VEKKKPERLPSNKSSPTPEKNEVVERENGLDKGERGGSESREKFGKKKKTHSTKPIQGEGTRTPQTKKKGETP